ncbi:oxygen-evolving enhancer protein 3-1, chloroplastic-like [Andrographis paniculata]|uniref:oxygen-evolving enhancer protein 3-1, chloroplastic-like n=1 Tax=Andrographis paniculata TaxID=175694 RepID=UPI0021E74185|nr:oxygen-evolving enhancer protein 3-1, chloroplastic-like [Andrographis paniculata]
MSQVMASLSNTFLGSSQSVADLTAAPSPTRSSSAPLISIRAHHHIPADTDPSRRRALLGLAAAGIASASFVQAVLADVKAKSIKIGPPPPPSGGLPGTLNTDIARDLDLPLKDRFFIQPLPPAEAAKRAKDSAKDIVNVKEQIDKKAWPYVQNDLRLRAELLRYDLKTIVSAKPREEKKALKDLISKLFQTISDLDHAAKIKSSSEAEKYYAQTVSALNDVLAKLG